MGEDPMTMEELTERVMELSDRVARLEALVEEFRKTRLELREDTKRLWDRIEEVRAELKEDVRQLREELKAEIRELRTYMVGGFIVVIAVSVLLKLLG
jgi:predicted  nucleic acid-binding Zn-ribbon protein